MLVPEIDISFDLKKSLCIGLESNQNHLWFKLASEIKSNGFEEPL